MALSDTASESTVSKVLTATAVLLAVLMVILDMTVVNVALPHMMGALGATPDQITWVLTSYIVAEAIVIPTSGFLAERFGRKRVIFVSVAGFVVASMLCGQSQTLAQMVVFRLLQGAFGASVVPLSQAIMVDTFEARNRGKAMAIWGIGILLGPIMGPTVGGFITDHLGWRWVYYINVPIGLINLAMILAFLKQTPRSRAVADWIGALLLAIGVGSLQMLLDRGNGDDWLQSNFIITLIFVSAFCLIAFAVRSYKRPDAILRLSLLRDHNLATATFMIMAFGVGMLSTIALQPLFLEHLLGYPASTAGLVMAPRGIAVAMGMVFVATTINRFEPRWLVLIGLTLASIGTYVTTWYNLDVDMFWIIAPGIVQGLGMGMIFVPLSTLAYQTLPQEASDQAAGIFNLARTIGGSIGIAVAATVLTRESHANWQSLGAGINPYNPALTSWLDTTGLSMSDPHTLQMLAMELTRQSTMIGFIEAFGFVTLSFLVLIPLVLLLRKQQGDGPRRSPI
ncbi:EmrB/QacA subfamily drug resistance transporter [Hyphomicrobium denitrificans 1NES1]|uniref:EmrB/QacA subfamily drug resistance transporter n=1 Tax=Hyphomicrobium denitrificans 1NES1 TaxID=670307 RepID=N0BDI0_9HYPH|nr:DHA2 family efflux MFS transporter permease subunit [Hyphomicrobium denitrificans]AGK58531.1 EmrB/QacA subfamily drug resistance transporter [Hyphomicrobium denitrificans 1NES1]